MRAGQQRHADKGELEEAEAANAARRSPASETSTFTGVPVSASIEPACAAKTSGIRSCEEFRLSRTAMTTTTGSKAATAPLTLISAVSSATRLIVRTRSRVRLSSPAPRMRSWPAQAVTPVISSPELTTKSEAMKMTAGSPKPPSACPSVRTPVAHSASGDHHGDDDDRAACSR